VFNPSDGQVISSEVVWARSMASPHTLMRSECYVSGQRLQNAIVSFKTAALKTLGMIPVSERQQAGSLKITHAPGRVHWTVIEVLLRLLWEAWFRDTNEERSMAWNSSVKLTARCLMGSAQILLAMYWKFTSTPTASDPLVKKGDLSGGLDFNNNLLKPHCFQISGHLQSNRSFQNYWAEVII